MLIDSRVLGWGLRAGVTRLVVELLVPDRQPVLVEVEVDDTMLKRSGPEEGY